MSEQRYYVLKLCKFKSLTKFHSCFPCHQILHTRVDLFDICELNTCQKWWRRILYFLDVPFASALVESVLGKHRFLDLTGSNCWTTSVKDDKLSGLQSTFVDWFPCGGRGVRVYPVLKLRFPGA